MQYISELIWGGLPTYVESGDTAYCQKLLEGNAKLRESLNQPQDSGELLLDTAIKLNHLATARLLLEHKADPMQRDSRQSTPLHRAVGNLAALELLMHFGGDPFCFNSAGSTPFHTAASQGQVEAVQLMLRGRTSQVNLPNSQNGHTALHEASFNGHKLVVETLLAHDAQVNQDAYGTMPLHYAAQQGYPDIVKALILAKAVVNPIAVADQATPLIWAARSACTAEGNKIQTLELLLEAKADVELKDKNGLTALQGALNMVIPCRECLKRAQVVNLLTHAKSLGDVSAVVRRATTVADPSVRGKFKGLKKTESKTGEPDMEEIREALEDRNCLLCLEAKRDCVILPCKHMHYCHDCLLEWQKQCHGSMEDKCPTCRVQITAIIKCYV